MTKTVKVAACQTPDIRSDIDAALACVENYAEQTTAQGVELLCFPEGFLQGYETRAVLAQSPLRGNWTTHRGRERPESDHPHVIAPQIL